MKKFILTILILVSFTSCKPEKFTLYLKTKNVSGLVTGSEVQINGIKTGEVESIKLDSKYDIIITALFDENIDIPTDSKFTLISTDFLGTKGINLKIGDKNSYLLSRDTILLNPMVDTKLQIDSAFINIMESVVEQFSTKKLLDSLQNELEEINEKLDKQN